MPPRHAIRIARLFTILTICGIPSIARGQSQLPDLLMMQGRGLTAKQVEALEKKIEQDPEDLDNRGRLLGYYFNKSRTTKSANAARIKHALWIIEHHPESPIASSPMVEMCAILEAAHYEEAKTFWQRHLADKPKDTTILGHAAEFFLLNDKKLAEDLLKRAQELEPDNAEWPERLGRLYALDMQGFMRRPDAAIARKALRAYEDALKKTPTQRRYYILDDAARTALYAGDLEKARTYASELLDNATEQRPNWNYGNAVHEGNMILGQVALAEDDLEKAETFLKRAGKTPGSPQLNSFGPNMRLAYDLLGKGRKDAVIEYLRLCGTFWNKSQVDTWIAQIEKGQTPNFGFNMRY